MAREVQPPKDARPKKKPAAVLDEKKVPPLPAPSSDPADDQETPLPATTNRPGTSGTEMLLATNRRRASERFQQATRAERMYVAQKRSAASRADYAAAKQHLRAGLRHLRQALSLSLAVVQSTPYRWRERSEARRVRNDERRRLQLAEKSRRLEAQLAKQQMLMGAGGEGGESGPGEEDGTAKGLARSGDS